MSGRARDARREQRREGRARRRSAQWAVAGARCHGSRPVRSRRGRPRRREDEHPGREAAVGEEVRAACGRGRDQSSGLSRERERAGCADDVIHPRARGPREDVRQAPRRCAISPVGCRVPTTVTDDGRPRTPWRSGPDAERTGPARPAGRRWRTCSRATRQPGGLSRSEGRGRHPVSGVYYALCSSAVPAGLLPLFKGV